MRIPRALTVAVSAAQAVERIGMPEGQIILSQAAAYVACAPRATRPARPSAAPWRLWRRGADFPFRSTFRIAITAGRQSWAEGTAINTPHDYPKQYVEQQYLPDGLKDRTLL